MDQSRTAKLKARLKSLLAPRHLLVLGGILLCCTLVFGFVGNTYLDDAADRSERRIVNDDYAVLTEPLQAGDELRQQLVVKEKRLYGVGLLLSTGGRVPAGTVHLRLEDAAGNTVATNTTDAATLLDNTFHRFLLEPTVEPAEKETPYTLVITAQPATEADAIAFYRSDGTAESYLPEGSAADAEPRYHLTAFSLAQNGQPSGGTLALQYTIKYAGGFIYTAFAVCAVFLTLFLLGLYLAIFVWRAALHRLFIYCALGLGLVFIFLIPPRAAPDEYVHVGVAYRHSNTLLSPGWNDGATITMRGGDAMALDRYHDDYINIYAYRELYEGLFEMDPGLEPVQQGARAVDTYLLPQLIPTAGVVLARLLGLGKVPLLVLGRLANLLFYTIVVSRAIKRLPIAKPMLFCAGLLPMSLQLAASFSHDVWPLALSFYFIALCLHYAYGEGTVLGWRQLLLLGATAVLLVPAKVVYMLLLPLALIIPAARYQSKKWALGGRVAVIGVALAVWAVFSLGSVFASTSGSVATVTPPEAATSSTVTAPAADAGPGQEAPPAERYEVVDGEVLQLRSNGDAYQRFTPGYILRHPAKTIRLLARSAWEQSPLWLQGLLGGRLGEVIAVNIEVNWLFVLALVGLLGCAVLPTQQDGLTLKKSHRWLGLGLCLAVAGALALTCLMWTPANYLTIFGLQGRYFLPVLPLLMLVLRSGRLRFAKPPVQGIVFAFCGVVLLCQLSAFTTIIQL